MPDVSGAHRQIRMLTARVIAAEKAAGMNNSDIATARFSMENSINERVDAVGKVADEMLLAFRLSALHARLHNAEAYRTARRRPLA